MTQRKMPKWAKILLWTAGILVLGALMYFHLTSGGGPGRHV